jgi:hypothetical protein
MFNAFLALLSPLLLVFGLYHLFTWFNIFRINERAYWRRVGLTSAISHFLLATGFYRLLKPAYFMAAIGRFQKGEDIFHAKVVDGELFRVRGDVFGSPDGLWFDARGVLWIQTDVSTSVLHKGDYARLGIAHVLVREGLRTLIERETPRALARFGGSDPTARAAPRRGRDT